MATMHVHIELVLMRGDCVFYNTVFYTQAWYSNNANSSHRLSACKDRKLEAAPTIVEDGKTGTAGSWLQRANAYPKQAIRASRALPERAARFLGLFVGECASPRSCSSNYTQMLDFEMELQPRSRAGREGCGSTFKII